MEDKIKKQCSNCLKEVELESKMEVQVCPECGKPLTPCTLCLSTKDEFFDGCKNDCPFKIELAIKTKKWKENNK